MVILVVRLDIQSEYIEVKRGDTLGQIAEIFGTRASKIRRWNNLKYGSHLIHPGQKLVIWVK